MKTVLTLFVLAGYRGVGEPLRALGLKRARLAAFGLGPDDPLPAVEVDPIRAADCAPGCRFDPTAPSVAIDRYVERPGRDGWLARRARLTPTAIDLARYPDVAALEAALRKRSSRTLPKIRRAREAGYVVRRFPVARHVFDVHAVKTSMSVRAGGPVLDYWLLRPGDIVRPSQRSLQLRPPRCQAHWTEWWGVFLPEPGRMQGTVRVDERLVAYVKAARRGDLLHYADIMGHRDHLDRGVMALLHFDLMRWLIASGDPMAAGVRAVLYGGAEHGREGLLTWKKRAGFEPMRLVLKAAPDEHESAR
jgi:hypothetical protein